MRALSPSTAFTSVEEARAGKQWVVIDATGLVVGRLAAITASRLRGKHKATFTPHVDDGDVIVIVNAEKVIFTGRKLEEKKYSHYTGYQGGLKVRTARFILDGRFPERVVEKAVERMLPRGPLGRRQLGNLRVYKGADHPHTAQQPTLLDVSSLNPKNTGSAWRRDAPELSGGGHGRRSNVAGDGTESIFHAYRYLRSHRDLFEKLDNKRFSGKIKDMETGAINSEIQRLVLQLDSDETDCIRGALARLSIILPRLDLNRCLKDAELRKTLRSVPDRLFAALSDNLEESGAAKSAAFALVAAMYPEHYRAQLGADEKVVRVDLEDIFGKNDVHSFLTVKAEVAGGGANIDARLWNGMPFELGGVKPALAPSALTSEGGLGIEVSGARAVRVESVLDKDLRDGQLVGVKALLEPQPESAPHRKVIMDFVKSHAVFSREVFDFDTLFPSTTEKAG